jgi:hypothetical protein
MVMLMVGLSTNIRTFWWHGLFWTLLHLSRKNVCFFPRPLSATQWKPIFFTVFQTSYVFPPTSFPVKFQNYIFLERRFTKSVARHYIVYSFPVTSLFSFNENRITCSNSISHCASNVFCIQNNHDDIKSKIFRGTGFDVYLFFMSVKFIFVR